MSYIAILPGTGSTGTLEIQAGVSLVQQVSSNGGDNLSIRRIQQ